MIQRTAPRLALLVALACGCAEPPAAPTPPVVVEPPPPAVSMEIEPTTARVGEWVNFTYRLSAPVDYVLEFWTEVAPPAAYAATFGTGETFESGPLTFPINQTVLKFSTGYLRDIDVGTWSSRIKGDRLPEGVVLGEPRGGTWTVEP